MNTDVMPRRDNDEYGEQIYTKAVRAGKRTYFFDVKATRNDDSNGNSSYSRHKIYLYKEDFRKFMGGLSEMIDYIKVHKPEFFDHDDTAAADIDEEFEQL